MKRIVKKRFLKKKKNFNIIIFDVVHVKDSNANSFIKYYIDDTTTISNSFTKFLFKFENFLEKESAAQTHEKEQKKSKEERERELRKNKKKKTDE